MIIPNKHPIYNSPRRLAIIGECPGVDDELTNIPFSGASGNLLNGILSNLKIARDQVFIGNVCQHRAPDNDINQFEWSGTEIQTGLQQLQEDLLKYKPTCCLLLGRTALRAFYPEVVDYDKKGAADVPIGAVRGTVFMSNTFNVKCVASYHPSYILRVFADLLFLRNDVARAWEQAEFSELKLPQREITIRPTLFEVQNFCQCIRETKCRIGFDLEGYCDNVGMTCISFAISPTKCLVIPFWVNQSHYWSADEEVIVWQEVASVLSDPTIPKSTQNGLYELFVLSWLYKIVVNGIVHDTMLQHFELFPELDKNLGIQTSLYTLEPFYKHERTSIDQNVQLTYNGKDSCVTEECAIAQENLLSSSPKRKAHYEFNVSLLPALTYMHLRGCKLSDEKIQRNINETEREILRLGGTVNIQKKTKSNADLLTGGLLESMVGRPINAKSTPDKKWLLYDMLGYKPYSKYGDSTEELVLHKYYQRERNQAVKTLIQLVSNRTRRSDIFKLTANADGRIRCNYNLVGTNTCRLSSSASNALEPYHTKTGLLKWDHTGTNLQNVTKELRECFIADDDCDMFQCDLSGADGWTVAADLAALGSPTMLDDYLAGIKPAKVLLLMLEEYEAGRNAATINNLSREELRRRTKAISFPEGRDELGRQGDWKYLCMKRVQHGTNYGMESEKLAETIFKDSDGTIDLSTKEAGIYQYLYRLRYNPDIRTAYIERQLRDKGIIRTACGFERRFYNIRYGRIDNDTLRQALAFEPQVNTTYLTNKALQSLWYDEQNRTSRGGLFIEPILQIHDALTGQWKKKYRDWAVEKTKSFFNHKLIIHGIEVQIPFEGNYGEDWLHTKTNFA